MRKKLLISIVILLGLACMLIQNFITFQSDIKQKREVEKRIVNATISYRKGNLKSFKEIDFSKYNIGDQIIFKANYLNFIIDSPYLFSSDYAIITDLTKFERGIDKDIMIIGTIENFTYDYNTNVILKNCKIIIP